MITGANTNTPTRYQLNEGMFLKAPFTGVAGTDEPNIVSATLGGATITIVPTIRQRGGDGVPANTKEFMAIDEYVVKASFVIVEITAENTKLAVGAADLTNNVIKPRHSVSSSDFSDLYWVGELIDGKKVQIKFSNAFNTNGFNFKTSPKGEGQYTLDLTAHYSVSSLDTVPVEITFIPNTSVVTFVKTPVTLTLVVKNSAGATQSANQDGTYTLLIGSYTYTASNTDYVTQTDVALAITNADAVTGTKSVTVTLEEVGE